MQGLFKYSHLSTKIRAMYGKMLNSEDYEVLIQKKSVKDVAVYLKNNTYYGDGLENLDETDVHRGHLEVLLYRAEITDTLKIAKYLNGKDKKLFQYVYIRQEISDIKNMVRHLQMGKPLDEIDPQTLFISWYSEIDFNKSLAAKNISELIDTLEHTPFYDILKPLQISETKIDMFSAEMALDLYYFTMIKQMLKTNFKGVDREVAYVLFGMEADIKNILWIYRGKFIYRLNKQLLYRYLIPLKYKMNKDITDKMIEMDNPKDLGKIISSSYYGEILSEDIKNWEHNYKVHLHSVMLRFMRRYTYSLTPVMSYLLMKEIEKHNITSVVEGIRYNTTLERIKKELIGVDFERR